MWSSFYDLPSLRFEKPPKYLLYKGEDAKAIATMQHIAKVNRQQCRLTIEDFQALEPNGCSEEVTSSDLLIPGQKGISLVRESSIKFRRWLERYKMLFDGFQMTRLTILVWLTYIMDFWGFTVAGRFALQHPGGGRHLFTHYQASILPESWLSKMAPHPPALHSPMPHTSTAMLRV